MRRKKKWTSVRQPFDRRSVSADLKLNALCDPDFVESLVITSCIQVPLQGSRDVDHYYGNWIFNNRGFLHADPNYMRTFAGGHQTYKANQLREPTISGYQSVHPVIWIPYNSYDSVIWWGFEYAKLIDVSLSPVNYYGDGKQWYGKLSEGSMACHKFEPDCEPFTTGKDRPVFIHRIIASFTQLSQFTSRAKLLWFETFTFAENLVTPNCPTNMTADIHDSLVARIVDGRFKHYCSSYDWRSVFQDCTVDYSTGAGSVVHNSESGETNTSLNITNLNKRPNATVGPYTLPGRLHYMRGSFPEI